MYPTLLSPLLSVRFIMFAVRMDGSTQAETAPIATTATTASNAARRSFIRPSVMSIASMQETITLREAVRISASENRLASDKEVHNQNREPPLRSDVRFESSNPKA